MTIRTDSELDKQILDALEADRAQLDRFASTPNRQLLGALVAPAATAAGFWTLASTKLLTLAAAVAVVGSVAFYATRPSPTALAPKPETTATVTSPRATPTSVEVPAGRSEARPHATAKAPKPLTPVTAASKVVSEVPQSEPKAQETIDLDHWSSGATKEVQLPTKIEVQTKAK